jgi:hypothetical protein
MRDQFMRIAMARLRRAYPFKPQRRAVAAKMWTEHLERYAMREWMRTEQELNATNGHHRAERQHGGAL